MVQQGARGEGGIGLAGRGGAWRHAGSAQRRRREAKKHFEVPGFVVRELTVHPHTSPHHFLILLVTSSSEGGTPYCSVRKAAALRAMSPCSMISLPTSCLPGSLDTLQLVWSLR